jgi:hypothetical protein
MNKRVLRGFIALFLVFAIAFPVTAFANSPMQNLFNNRGWRTELLSERSLTRRQEGIDIRGQIPDILQAFIAAEAINSHISTEVVDTMVAEARRLRARTITFSFEFYETEDIVSILIFADVLTTLPHRLVRSVNFNVFDGSILCKQEATGMDIIPLAERLLEEIIRSNPEHYYAALSAPLENQAFLITNERLTILFDGFRLSTRVGDVQEVEIIFSNIKTVTLTPDDYRPDGPYGLKMIPVRAMLGDQLGFDIYWNAAYRYAIISRNNIDIIRLTADDNEYLVFGTQRRSLEAAPQMFFSQFNGYRMYVPITFFDQILPLTTYTIDAFGNITFLSYIETTSDNFNFNPYLEY